MISINVQGNKALNKRLYKQDLSGSLNSNVTFNCVEPGVYLANVTIVPGCTGTGGKWCAICVNGYCGSTVNLYGAQSFAKLVTVTNTENVTINVCTRITGSCPVEAAAGSVVFLKQL